MDTLELTFMKHLEAYNQADEIPEFPYVNGSPRADHLIVTDCFMNSNLKISAAAQQQFEEEESMSTEYPNTLYDEFNNSKLDYAESQISLNNTFDTSDKLSSVSNRSNNIKKIQKKEVIIASSQLISGTGQNILKNFIKAISSFSTSDLALPYLIPLLDITNITQEQFVNYVCTYKERVDSLKGLVNLTTPGEYDNTETSICKKIFKELSITFLKFFAVNWIYGSNKLKHRQILLKNRFIIKRKN